MAWGASTILLRSGSLGIASIARSTEMLVDFQYQSRRAQETSVHAPTCEVEVPVLFLCAVYHPLSTETGHY